MTDIIHGTAALWPHVHANPELANQISAITNSAAREISRDGFGLLFSQRFAIANALLAAGWRPTSDVDD